MRNKMCPPARFRFLPPCGGRRQAGRGKIAARRHPCRRFGRVLRPHP
ncbi:MAG: hypothetical protein FWG36_09310 [Oscillospiraceae bacterium]|nr:hypothetical protein [Oscillospiraceae bacterium]